MQAIQTKFIPCTNHRPSRVKAWCERGSVTVEWDSALGVEDNHREAIKALLRKFVREDAQRYGQPLQSSWVCEWSVGCLPGGGYVAVSNRLTDIDPEDALADV